ncbi:coiled-coil domain-containing protein [Cyclobacterium marinum]|uniref:Uncharacterized protein n=1 Tax=Cyclobacterium marinum (strain ATCC 25205 / DSM 745 / LMG 13164 / NCIMB 1802) TaxID=880070 RepID=G0IZ66_CYCMS|nr:hypothetical protein [Cyclobacterium marinum]AEL23845.1 hypothetical protein Cycma_0060 [Cyclobacterium marinum DSM 745]
MENLDPINVEFLINSAEVKKDSDRVKADITGVNDTAEKAAIRTGTKVKQVYDQSAKEVLEFEKSVERSAAAMDKQGAVAARQKSQFNGLGNSINQISRELPAFTYSAQTGFLAISNNIPILADEINRLRVENQALTASGQKAVPVWKQVVSGLLSWQTALSLGVALLSIYGKDVIDWAASLFKAGQTAEEAALKTEAFNKAVESSDYTKAIAEVNELNQAIEGAKDGLVDKEAVLKMYNEGIGKTTGSLRTFNELEQWQIDNGDKYIQFMFKKAQAAAMLKLAIEKTTEAQANFNGEAGFEDYLTGGVKAFALGGLGGINAFAEANRLGRVAQLDKEAKQFFDLYNKYQTDFQKYAKENGFDIFGDGTVQDGNKTKKTIEARQRLLDQMAALDKEYARKSYTKDEEEVQALRDKFDKMRRLIDRFNAENKQNPIDTTGLGAIEEQATGDLLYRQDTEKLKQSLAEQKKLYESYERVKTDLGEAEAEKRYGAEIKAAGSYFDYLLKEYDKLNQLSGQELSGAQQERLQYIIAEIGKEKVAQDKEYDALIKSLTDYTTERELIIERHNERIAQLTKNGDTDLIAEAERQQQQELDAIDDANVKKLQSYKRLYDDTVALTRKSAKQALVEVRNLLDSESMSEDLRNDLLKKEQELEFQINKGDLDDIYKLSQALGGLGESLETLGEATGNSGIANLGASISGLSTGVNDVLTMFDDSATQADVASAAISGVVRIMNILSESAAQRREAEEAYYKSLIGFQQQYNLSLNEQIRLQSILGENVFLSDYEGRIRDGVESLTDANKNYMEALAALEDAYVKVGQRNAIDIGDIGKGIASGGLVGALAAIFGGQKKVDTLGPLLKEYPELISVMENGMVSFNSELAEALLQNDLLSERSKELVQNVLDWEEAMEAARQQIADVVKELVGGLGGDVRNALVESFEAGENAAIKMGETVEKVLENVVSQILFNSIFSDVFDQLQKDLEGNLAAGDTQGITENLGAFFANAQGLTADFNKALEQAQAAAKKSGFDIFSGDDSSSQSGLAGGIRRDLTEATGTELAGLFRGFYDISNRTLLTVEQQLTVDKQHYDATLTIMRSSAAIEQNTANAVAELKATVEQLKAINKNTKQNSTGYDRGDI